MNFDELTTNLAIYIMNHPIQFAMNILCIILLVAVLT